MPVAPNSAAISISRTSPSTRLAALPNDNRPALRQPGTVLRF